MHMVFMVTAIKQYVPVDKAYLVPITDNIVELWLLVPERSVTPELCREALGQISCPPGVEVHVHFVATMREIPPGQLTEAIPLISPDPGTILSSFVEDEEGE